LRKFPEHGGILPDIPQKVQTYLRFAIRVETLAMKGLFLYHLDQKAEAYDYVKKGLKNDLASSVCRI
jgi:peptide alpha-N-acetyltransferase